MRKGEPKWKYLSRCVSIRALEPGELRRRYRVAAGVSNLGIFMYRVWLGLSVLVGADRLFPKIFLPKRHANRSCAPAVEREIGISTNNGPGHGPRHSG